MEAEQTEPEPVQLPKLEIQLNQNGSVTVNGPIVDKMLCYGMLDMAKDAIFEYHLKQKLQPIKNGNGIIHKLMGR